MPSTSTAFGFFFIQSFEKGGMVRVSSETIVGFAPGNFVTISEFHHVSIKACGSILCSHADVAPSALARSPINTLFPLLVEDGEK